MYEEAQHEVLPQGLGLEGQKRTAYYSRKREGEESVRGWASVGNVFEGGNKTSCIGEHKSGNRPHPPSLGARKKRAACWSRKSPPRSGLNLLVKSKPQHFTGAGTKRSSGR